MITKTEGTGEKEAKRWMFWLALSIALLLGMATAAIADGPAYEPSGLVDEVRSAVSGFEP
jgi:hypothetical protein